MKSIETDQLIVELDLVDPGHSQELKVRSVNGRELPNWKDGPLLAEYRQTMRQQGWILERFLAMHCYAFVHVEPSDASCELTPAQLVDAD